MKTIQTAPIGADPLGDFMKQLPGKAAVLGCKVIRTAGKAVVYVCYYWDGKTINQSFSWEGGPL